VSKSHRSLALWSERLRQERHRSVRASGATPARFARILFWPPAVSASRAPRHHRCTTARLGFAERSLSGRFGAGALRPVLGVTAFSRNAERVGFRAQRYAPLRVRALSSSAIAAHRFGKPLHNAGQSNNQHLEPRRGQPVGALAASFLKSGGGNAKPNRRQCAPSCSP
jgi:hypothetical protein